FGSHLGAWHVRTHEPDSYTGERVITQCGEWRAVPCAGERERIRRVRTRERREKECRISYTARQRPVRVEIGPRRNHTGARNETKAWFHPHYAGELRGDAIGATVV